MTSLRVSLLSSNSDLTLLFRVAEHYFKVKCYETHFSIKICVGNSPVTGEFPSQRLVTWSFDVFFDLRLNKRLSKQSWGLWFEMPWSSLWIPPWPVNSPHKGPVMRKIFPFDDIILMVDFLPNSQIRHHIAHMRSSNMRGLWGLLTHLPLNKIAAISQTLISDTCSWMKYFVF